MWPKFAFKMKSWYIQNQPFQIVFQETQPKSRIAPWQVFKHRSRYPSGRGDSLTYRVFLLQKQRQQTPNLYSNKNPTPLCLVFPPGVFRSINQAGDPAGLPLRSAAALPVEGSPAPAAGAAAGPSRAAGTRCAALGEAAAPRGRRPGQGQPPPSRAASVEAGLGCCRDSPASLVAGTPRALTRRFVRV